jgi:hypothetical protein
MRRNPRHTLLTKRNTARRAGFSPARRVSGWNCQKEIASAVDHLVLIDPSGCGKATFARKYFKANEVLS